MVLYENALSSLIFGYTLIEIKIGNVEILSKKSTASKEFSRFSW